MIDRTAFNIENRDRLTLQKVPPEIYDAQYPAWFLNEEKFLAMFKDKYELILDFENNIDKAKIPAKYKGFLFKRKVN